MELTLRYCVCTPSDPPVEVFSSNSREIALDYATGDQVVYDWATGLVIK